MATKMTMHLDAAMRMSTTQILTALDRIERELAALLEDQRVLLEERKRRQNARRPRARSSSEN